MKKLKIGITGGIGSGKTTVCKIFETLGIPVYYADDRAKALMVEDKVLVAKIKDLFSEKAYFLDGSLNRKYIADAAFKNPQLLQELNQLVHPAVLRDGEVWHQRQENVPYTIKEAALMYESDSYKQMDKVITVYAPKEIRINRVLLRGQGLVSRDDVEARMSKQLSEEIKLQKADFIIYNDGAQALIPQVLKIHKMLLLLGV